MPSLITEGIKISVIAKYDERSSKPSLARYIHAYQVTIENLSGQEVQLLSRHWYIYSSSGTVREIEGDGVIGEQPVLAPFDTHTYTSWCPLPSPMGKMHGYYTMIETESKRQFDVEVPEFKLVADFVNN